mgnify:CR=1 FL=1
MQPAPPPGQGDATRSRGARTLALPWIRPGRARGAPGLSLALASARERLKRALALEAERRRLFIWLPVPMGIGILLYFAADREPALWAPLVGFLLAAAGAVGLRRRPGAARALIALAAVFAGFAAATWRTASVASPLLDRPRIGQLTGFVESVESRDAGARLVILVTGLAGVEAAERPRRVRSRRAITSRRWRGCCRHRARPGQAAMISAATPSFAGSARSAASPARSR